MPEHGNPLPPARYETQDLDTRLLSIGAAGVLAALVLSILLVAWIFPSVMVDRRLAGTLADYPPPRLQTDPAADLRGFVRGELSQLNGSGWIDQSKGIAHIPIDAAMRQIARQGIPDWPAPEGKPP